MIGTICVCGAGTMGSGIAQHFALHGRSVILFDLEQRFIDRARVWIEKDLDKGIEKGKIDPAEKEATLARIRFTTRHEDCIAPLIIEAIIEKPEAKTSLFHSLSKWNKPDTIFASNTSSLSIEALAGQIPNPERVAGLHFFNPAPLMKLVEIVTTPYSDPAVILALQNLCTETGKIPVVCKDSPGFIVNRVARPFYIESLRMAEEGKADLATIDQLLENAGFRMGPFRLMDLIGNDVNYAVSVSVYEQLGQPERLKPSYLQKEKVDKGEWGKKSGKGYYDWQKT
ncbi:MAG: 3-hydroxybutyryl-CoA dehydrogenase [Chitinophagaceae bacterium]|nr:3-hydroxybutyryl-CoA dehydrogenase [Chitinophagaceae bacterium]MBN8666601.1 3-hydroxybutyryl-CoA dehydrogenase [Chitinophagales bacterium]